jgi:anthranilate phosphoribosyltransferase
VLLNAGAALVVGGKADDIAVGIKLASEVIDGGAALAKLDQLVKYSQAIGA